MHTRFFVFVTCAREIRKVYTKFPKKAHELLKTFRFDYKILSRLYANFSALLDWRLPEKNARLVENYSYPNIFTCPGRDGANESGSFS